MDLVEGSFNYKENISPVSDCFKRFFREHGKIIFQLLRQTSCSGRCWAQVGLLVEKLLKMFCEVQRYAESMQKQMDDQERSFSRTLKVAGAESTRLKISERKTLLKVLQVLKLWMILENFFRSKKIADEG